MTSPDWQLVDGAALGDPAAALSPDERAAAAAFAADKRRHDWVLGRMAAKAAVRALLQREGRPAPPPADVVIEASPTGAPCVRPLDDGDPIVVSISHGHGLAAGWALRAGPRGGLPGIDLERIRPRKEGTLRFYLTPEERHGVLALPAGSDDAAGPRDDLAVRLWAIKEAAFKALRPPRGMGLLDVRAAVDEEGGAQVSYAGRLLERAQALGARDVRARWTRQGDLCVAWVEVVGASAV